MTMNVSNWPNLTTVSLGEYITDILQQAVHLPNQFTSLAAAQQLQKVTINAFLLQPVDENNNNSTKRDKPDANKKRTTRTTSTAQGSDSDDVIGEGDAVILVQRYER